MMSRLTLLGCLLLTGCQSAIVPSGFKPSLYGMTDDVSYFAPGPSEQVAYEAKLREREAAAKQHGGGKCACCR